MDNRTVTSVNDGMRRRRRILYKITIYAVFLSLELVIKTFNSFYLPILGAAGIKVSFSGILRLFPHCWRAGYTEAIVCALSDLLGYIISRQARIFRFSSLRVSQRFPDRRRMAFYDET